MDILNFISWIKGKRVVTSVDPAKTLIPVGLKDGRRDDGYLAGAITVADLLGNTPSGAGISEYKQALLPSKSLVTSSVPQPNLVGKAFDLNFSGFAYPYIELANGNIAQVYYCQSVLENGILIYEAYDIEDFEGISGYWVAFKQNEQNPKLLEKVAELQMTQQFWDNWYDWTVKDSGDSAVKFVVSNNPFNNNVKIESYITTLTYANGVLSATDTLFIFGGATVFSLYQSLSGGVLNPELDYSWTFQRPEYILDDDYYGMALGSQAGWYYYRNTTLSLGDEWNSVGFNVLTGQTRWVTPVVDIVANVTNFNFTDVDTNKFIQGWFNHPNGITFQFSDAQLINNGNNVNGVTCIWSPFYENPNEVIYLTTRDSQSGVFDSTGGLIMNTFAGGWYWDNVNLFTYSYTNTNQAKCLLVQRFNTNTKEITSWNIPFFEEIQSFVQSYANNNGLIILVLDEFGDNIFGKYTYMYFTSNNYPYTLQSNNSYPTNAFLNKTYSTYSGLLRNVYNLGVEIDEYTDVVF